MYKKILVPLDGSELAECALPHVKSLVKDGFSGEVNILKVFSCNCMEFKKLHSRPGYIELREEAFDESQKYLLAIKSQLSAEGIQIKTELIEGDRPANIIADYVHKNGIDLIIIATRGYTGLIREDPGSGKKMLLGSVALKVLHNSDVPVLLIRSVSL